MATTEELDNAQVNDTLNASLPCENHQFAGHSITETHDWTLQSRTVLDPCDELPQGGILQKWFFLTHLSHRVVAGIDG